MAVCGKCGAGNAYGNAFCHSCGGPIPTNAPGNPAAVYPAPAPAPFVPAAAAPSSQTYVVVERSRRKTIGPLTCCIGIFCFWPIFCCKKPFSKSRKHEEYDACCVVIFCFCRLALKQTCPFLAKFLILTLNAVPACWLDEVWDD